MAPRFQIDTPSDKKDAIVKSVVNNLQQEGDQFVAQSDEGVWEEVSLKELFAR